MTDALRAAWPHLRAAFVAFHVLAVLLVAMPAPGGGTDRRQWTDPTVQAEFRSWRARFDRFGVHMTEQQFEDRLATAATSVMGAREWLLWPFRPYYKYCGTDQSWRMFVAPHTFPERLHIELEEGGAWRPLYVERDREHAWHAEVFDHDRVRSAIFRYAWARYRSSFAQFADWTAGVAAREFPDATRVRLRYWKQQTPTAAEVRAGHEPAGSWDDEMVRKLAEFR